MLLNTMEQTKNKIAKTPTNEENRNEDNFDTNDKGIITPTTNIDIMIDFSVNHEPTGKRRWEIGVNISPTATI